MDICNEANVNLVNIEKEEGPEVLKFFKKLPNYFNMASGLANIYFLPAIETKYIWTEQI